MQEQVKWLLLILFLIIVQGLVYQQFLVLTEQGLRVIFTTGTFIELVWVCLTILVIFTVRAFTSFVIPTISAKLTTAALFELRSDLAKHILKLPQSYFDKIKSGDLILRLVNQVQELSTFVGQTLFPRSVLRQALIKIEELDKSYHSYQQGEVVIGFVV